MGLVETLGYVTRHRTLMNDTGMGIALIRVIAPNLLIMENIETSSNYI